MGYDYKQLLNDQCSDKLLLASMADYFDSFNERISKVTDYISRAAAGEFGYDDEFVPPAVEDIAVPYIKDNVTYPFKLSDLIECAALANDTVEDYTQSIEVAMSEVLDPLSDSYAANIAMTEALRTISDNLTKASPNLTSDFKNRIELKMGGLTSSVCSYGYAFINVLNADSLSVRDKIKQLLKFIGVKTENEPVIGEPESDFSDISGTNVWISWTVNFTEWRVWKEEFWDQLGDLFVQLWENVKSLLAVISGSATWRKVTKYFNVLTTTADAFDYTNYDNPDRMAYDDCYQTFEISGFGGDASTVLGAINMVNKALVQNYVAQTTIADALFWIRDNQYIPGTEVSIIGRLLAAGFKNFDRTKSFLFNFNKHLAAFVSAYRDTTSNKLTILDFMQYLIDLLIESRDLAATAFFAKLSPTHYIRVDLPCSTLYAWRSGTNMYIKRAIVPVAAPNGAVLYTNKNKVDAMYAIRKYDELFNVLNSVKQYSNRWIEKDDDQYEAIIKAHLIDGWFLETLENMYLYPSMNQTQSLLQVYTGILNFSDGTFYFPVTPAANLFLGLGKWPADLSDHTFSTPGTIQGVDIASLICGAPLNDPLIRLTVGDRIAAHLVMTYQAITDDTQGFTPFVRTVNLMVGAYNVMKNSNLTNILGKTILAIAIVVASVVAIKLLSKLKQRAFALEAKAGSMSWAAAEAGSLSGSTLRAAYKAQKRANIINAIISKFSGAIPSLVSSIGSKISNVTTGISSRLSEDVANGVTVTDNGVADIKKLITGYST